MTTRKFGFLLFMLFAVFSVTNAWVDELFDADEYDTLSSLDENINEFAEINVNKQQCRHKYDGYYGERCLKSHCKYLCKRDGYTSAKCRKYNKDSVKNCYCYKDCEKQLTPAYPPSSPANPPALSPVPNTSPVYPPSSPSDSPAVSPVPNASPAYPPSSPAPAPASPVEDPPCDDSDDAPTDPPPKPRGTFGQFSDEDFHFIFS